MSAINNNSNISCRNNKSPEAHNFVFHDNDTLLLEIKPFDVSPIDAWSKNTGFNYKMHLQKNIPSLYKSICCLFRLLLINVKCYWLLMLFTLPFSRALDHLLQIPSYNFLKTYSENISKGLRFSAMDPIEGCNWKEYFLVKCFSVQKYIVYVAVVTIVLFKRYYHTGKTKIYV